MAKPILLALFIASICTLGTCHHESPFAGADEENEMGLYPAEIDMDRSKISNSGRRFIFSNIHALRHAQRTSKPNLLGQLRGKDDNDAKMRQSASGNKFNVKNAPDMRQTNVKHIERVIGRKKRSPTPEDGPSFIQEANNNVKNVNNTPSMSQSNVKTNIQENVPIAVAAPPKPLVQKPLPKRSNTKVLKVNRKNILKSKDRKKDSAIDKKIKKKDKAAKVKTAKKQ